jgi:hypothetical protein
MARSDLHREVVDHLRQYGPIEDPAGRATAEFKTALGFEGSFAAFTQLIAAMEREGTLSRSVKGRRTYRIALAASDADREHQMADLDSTRVQHDMDYDVLAAALLTKVVQAISTNANNLQAPENPQLERSWTRRQVERLESRNIELEGELSRTRAELKVSTNESSNLKTQLEHCQGNLALLTDKFSSRKPGSNAASRLGLEDRALLTHLLSSESKDRPNRAS